MNEWEITASYRMLLFTFIIHQVTKNCPEKYSKAKECIKKQSFLFQNKVYKAHTRLFRENIKKKDSICYRVTVFYVLEYRTCHHKFKMPLSLDIRPLSICQHLGEASEILYKS